MAYLSYAQLRAYAAAAGAPDPDTAAAVAMAETAGTGDTNAHNAIPPDDSYGPWQINMLGQMGADRRKALGITSNTQLYDPVVNARAMMLVSNGGTNFGPWTTYKNGAYRHYLKGAGASSTTGGATVPADATQATSNPLKVGASAVGAATDAAGIAVDAANWIVNPSNWLRVAYVIGGGLVVIVGLDLLLQNAVLGRAAKMLGGDGGGSTSKSAAVIGRKVTGGMLAPARKAKAAGNEARAKQATAKAAKAAPKKASGSGATSAKAEI